MNTKNLNQGERIKALRESKPLSQAKLAIAVGVSTTAVQNWESGRNSILDKYLEPLSQCLGVTEQEIKFGTKGFMYVDQASPPTNNIRESNAVIYGHFDTWDGSTPLTDDEVEVPFFMDVELAAGIGAESQTEKEGPKLRFSKSTLRSANVQAENAACVKVSGNSMEPRLYDGDVVGVDLGSRSIVDGKTYAINHDGMLRVKRLYRMPKGGIRINSLNNDEHPDEVCDAEERKSVIILGKVFWSASMW